MAGVSVRRCGPWVCGQHFRDGNHCLFWIACESLSELRYADGEIFCVEGGSNLGVVVKIDVDVTGNTFVRPAIGDPLRSGISGLVPLSPFDDTVCPAVQILVTVTTGVENFGAVQADVNEIRSDIHATRPLDRVGADERDVLSAQQIDEFLHQKTGVPYFEGVAELCTGARAHVGPLFRQPLFVPMGDSCCFFGVAREKLEEGFNAGRIEPEIGRKLPENGPEFLAEPKNAGCEEVGESGLDIFQLQHVRYIAGAFYREDEIGWSFGDPALEAGGNLKRVKRTVNFDRTEIFCSESELAFLREVFWIEDSAPGLVAPTRNAYADITKFFHGVGS